MFKELPFLDGAASKTGTRQAHQGPEQAKMLSGDVYKVTEVVRDVWCREQDKSISAGEKSMLARARQILVSELALAQDTTTEEADTWLLEALHAPTQ